jgi:hypothetical protein
MKHPSKIILATAFILSMLATTIVTAQTSSLGAHVVGRVQVNGTSGVVYTRPAGLGPWNGGTGCTTATYAYIVPTLAGFENIFSLIVASKLNNTRIYFSGVCSASGGYFMITYAYLL